MKDYAIARYTADMETIAISFESLDDKEPSLPPFNSLIDNKVSFLDHNQLMNDIQNTEHTFVGVLALAVVPKKVNSYP